MDLPGEEPTRQALAVLEPFNNALLANDAEGLKECFYADQAYWKDQLALTYHLRTFTGSDTIVASLLETKALRQITAGIKLETAQFIPATPTLVRDLPKFRIEIGKIRINNLEKFDTDVFIVGAGNAAIALAARLKALGVESVMAERNANVGDNWALRYDCYDKHLQYPHLLTRDDLADQVRRYVAAFNLNVITSAQIKSTLYDQSSQRWTITFQTPAGQCTAVAKHLVQATGIGSQKPYLPRIADRHLYRGISLHSAQFKSAAKLKEQGVKVRLRPLPKHTTGSFN
ncbi:hypothetical protein SLS54_000519 [Diplodia seriata]